MRFLMTCAMVMLLAGSASAGLVLDFAGGGPEDAERFEITFASGTPDTINEWDTGGGLDTYPADDPDGSFTAGDGVTGSLMGAGGSLGWDQISSTSWSVGGGGALTVNNLVDITRNSADGWGVAGGDIEDGDLLGFDFDLSSLTLPGGQFARITQITTSLNGSSDAILAVVDGVGSTSVSPSGTDGEGNNVYNLSIDVIDGTRVGFTPDAGASDFRLDTMTVSLVPEPATLALLGLGGAGMLIRRWRSR